MGGTYYINNNGKVSQGKLPADFSFSDVLSSLWTDADFFSTPLLNDFISKPPVRFKKSGASSEFPPSSKWVTEEKNLHYEVGLCGVTEDELSVSVDDNKIIVVVKKEKSDEKRAYDWKGLKLPTNEKLEFTFDPRFYDVDTIKVELKNGLLSIKLSPREELKPKKATLFGKLDTSEKKEESSTEE